MRTAPGGADGQDDREKRGCGGESPECLYLPHSVDSGPSDVDRGRFFPSTSDARALSPNGRAHWATKRMARKTVASEVVIAATQQRLREVSAPVRLTFRYVFPDRRNRDVDNLTTGVTKCAIDALVRGRWLVADDSEHVTEVKAEAVVEKGSRRLDIVIEPAGPTARGDGEG